MALTSPIGGMAAVARARTALAQFVSSPDAEADGMLPAALLALDPSATALAAARVLDRYGRQTPAYGRENARRYRWSLGFRTEPGHVAYAEPAARASWWRPMEAAWLRDHPGSYARRLVVPVALASQFEFWSAVADGADATLAAAAREVLDEAQPVADADVARWVAGDDPWADTFALWLLTGHRRAHARLRDLTFALAVRYGQIALRYGVVPGIRFPFFGEALVSATAHLAASLWRLGIYPSLLPSLLSFVSDRQNPDGGWADPGQPSDVLTTLAAAELVCDLDPDFDPGPVVGFFVDRQEPRGWWRALNPEVPWLTAAIASWIERVAEPFPQRFSWPELPVWSRDRTTGLPTMAVFDELSAALAGIPGLAHAPLEVAFLDLAGFREFNNSWGQPAGDAALAAYAAVLRTLPGTLTIRQGGDELLVIGTPGTPGVLEPLLVRFMRDWPREAERVAVPPEGVVPRILLTRGEARELRAMRGRLGVEFGPFKMATPEPTPPGVLAWIRTSQPDVSPSSTRDRS